MALNQASDPAFFKITRSYKNFIDCQCTLSRANEILHTFNECNSFRVRYEDTIVIEGKKLKKYYGDILNFGEVRFVRIYLGLINCLENDMRDNFKQYQNLKSVIRVYSYNSPKIQFEHSFKRTNTMMATFTIPNLVSKMKIQVHMIISVWSFRTCMRRYEWKKTIPKLSQFPGTEPGMEITNAVRLLTLGMNTREDDDKNNPISNMEEIERFKEEMANDTDPVNNIDYDNIGLTDVANSDSDDEDRNAGLIRIKKMADNYYDNLYKTKEMTDNCLDWANKLTGDELDLKTMCYILKNTDAADFKLVWNIVMRTKHVTDDGLSWINEVVTESNLHPDMICYILVDAYRADFRHAWDRLMRPKVMMTDDKLDQM